MALNTGNPYLDALGGTPWGSHVIKFSFDNSAESTGGAWTASEQSQFRKALTSWSVVANIQFLEVADPAAADITERKMTTADFDDPNDLASHGTPDQPTHIGRFNTNLNWTPTEQQTGGYTFETFVHELGHAIGLAHPHDTGMGTGIFPGVAASGDLGTNNLNTVLNTVMSYNDVSDPDTAVGYGFDATPMAFDIAAIQRLYGAVQSNDGDNVYVLPDADRAGTFYSCIWDTGGNDTIWYNGSKDATIDLRPASLANAEGGGGFLSGVKDVLGGVTIAADSTGFIPDVNGVRGVIIENATGGRGSDTITGNGASNVLRGGAGADKIYGGSGFITDADTLIGGAGADTLDGQEGVDTADYSDARSGIFVDLISGRGIGGDATGDTLVSIEIVRGTNFADTLLGSNTTNALYGLGGGDTLTGGGNDSLYGGIGDDTYIVASTADVPIEFAGEGHDTVRSSVRQVLGANLEDLVLTGSANINGFGNELANRLTGNSGNNYLQGFAGRDVLEGGDGNDYYELGDLTHGAKARVAQYDTVVEAAGAGIDTVSVTPIVSPGAPGGYTLGANIENGIIQGTLAFSLTGNELDNTLTGNDAANTLTGWGGADFLDGRGGFDTLVGGVGNDTYILGDLTYRGSIFGFQYDGVTEAAGEGIDTIIITSIDNPDRFSTSGYTLGANIENGIIAGALDFDLTGNELDNALTGNGAANILTGLGGNDRLNGGDGIDNLSGGSGNDTYILNDLNYLGLFSGFRYDRVTEAAGEGIDTVIVTSINNPDRISTSGYTLGANFENGIIAGSIAFNLTGNELDNSLTGNGAANTLTGLGGNDILDGGSAADTMIGGAGDDIYYVDTVARFDWLGDIPWTPGDVVIEYAGQGVDTVYSLVSFALSDYVEKLVLTGTANLYGGGNALDNSIIGNAGDNNLDGGAGGDRLDGGLGNDTASFGSLDAGVSVNLAKGTATGQGVDTLVSIENVIGSGSSDIIVGSKLVNVLDGAEGNDTLTGAAGADTFVFHSGSGNDRVTDFTAGNRAGHDVIHFDPGLLADFADLLAHAFDVGADIVIQYGAADTITLDHVHKAALTAADFLFA